MTEITDRPQPNPEAFDRLLDRVLAGVGAPAPAEGIEHRILAGVQARTAARKSHTILGWPYAFAWASGLVPVGLAAAAIVAISIGSHTSPRPRPIRTATVAPAILAHAAASTSASALSPRRSSLYPSTRPATHRIAAPQAATPDAEDLALSEMRAPSQPAPELPLTAQERLLAQMAEASHPVEVAAAAPPKPTADPAELQTVLASLSKTLFAGMKSE